MIVWFIILLLFSLGANNKNSNNNNNNNNNIIIALFIHKLKTTHISRYKTSNFEQSYTVILLNPSNMQLSSTIHPPCGG